MSKKYDTMMIKHGFSMASLFDVLKRGNIISHIAIEK